MQRRHLLFIYLIYTQRGFYMFFFKEHLNVNNNTRTKCFIMKGGKIVDCKKKIFFFYYTGFRNATGNTTKEISR